MRVSVHHKTGSALFGSIRRQLPYFCGIKQKNTYFIPSAIGGDNVQSFFKRSDIAYYHLYHFTRYPLDIILSGFYYHSTRRESWLFVPFNNSTNGHDGIGRLLPFSYIDLVNNKSLNITNNKYSQLTKDIKYCYTTLEYLPRNIQNKLSNFIENIISVSLYKDNNMNLNIQQFYGKYLNIHNLDVLFWEFLAYFNCAWPEQLLVTYFGNNNFTEYYHEFLMKDWRGKENYKSQINILMDGMNFINNKENKKRGLLFGINDFDDKLIERNRETLSSKYFRKGDISKRRVRHSTQNEYDYNENAHHLLSMDVIICNIIKNMTIFINMDWKHSEYC